jgi:hypothetical protein
VITAALLEHGRLGGIASNEAGTLPAVAGSARVAPR